MIFQVLFISKIAGECLPGSAECEGNLIKVCESRGEWVEINCPENTTCGIDENKISCKPSSHSKVPQPTESGGEKKQKDNSNNGNNNDQGQKGQENTNNEMNGGNKPEENSNNNPENKPENNSNGDNNQPNNNQNTGSQENDKGNNNGGNNSGDSGVSNADQGNKPEKKDENSQNTNQEKKDGQQNHEEPKKETIPAIPDNKPEKIIEKTVYIVKTVTEPNNGPEESKKIEQSIENTIKHSNLPCCDEDLAESCRICKGSRPIRAIVIDRESILGNSEDKKPNETEAQNQTNNSEMGQSGSSPGQKTNDNQSGSSEEPKINEIPMDDQPSGQQSSGPPKKPTDSSNKNSSSSKFLQNNSNNNNSHSGTSDSSGNSKNAGSQNLTDSNNKSTHSNSGDEKSTGLEKSKLAGQQPSSGGNNSSSSSGGGGGGDNISADELMAISHDMNYFPKKELLEILAKEMRTLKGGKSEQAMFVAQLIHESAGMTALEEIGCQGSTKCSKNYDDGKGQPGKSYHGRGLIQLSWAANYQAASKDLGLGDKLVQNPELVSNDVEIAAKTAVWYWKSRVANAPGVKDMKFGATTKAINGALECTGQNVDKSKKRWEIYQKVAKHTNPPKKATEDGCY